MSGVNDPLSKLEVGQVLWLKLQFKRGGEFSDKVHPYMVEKIDERQRRVDLIQFDSLEGKLHFALNDECHVIENREPIETVITKDSYAQLDKIIRIELFEELTCFRKTADKLSKYKADKLILKHRNYITDNDIEFENILNYTKEEIINNN